MTTNTASMKQRASTVKVPLAWSGLVVDLRRG